MQELITGYQQALKKYYEQTWKKHLREDEENYFFRQTIYEDVVGLGLLSITFPEEYGGLDSSFFHYTELLSELSRYSVSYAITASVSHMIAGILLQYASKDQKDHYLPSLLTGKMVGAFGLTESHSGSDASALKTSYQKTSTGYRLQGRKMFITSASIAGVYVVFARSHWNPKKPSEGISAFLIPAEAKGLSFGVNEKKMGWKSSPTREVILDNCEVPLDHLLGKEGDGFRVAMGGLDKGRIGVASVACGVAFEALEQAQSYLRSREQFQQALGQFQGLQFLFAEMKTEYECAKALVQKAAMQLDQQTLLPALASMAKLKSTDMAMEVTTQAVQLFGGVGITEEYPVERLMRDAKILQIVEGTNQIQKWVIARHFLNPS
jgi:butyryl-CoA dehydrogenase